MGHGIIKNSPGSPGPYQNHPWDRQGHTRFSHAVPGISVGFPWGHTRTGHGISLGSRLGSSGSHQEQMGDRWRHTQMSCRTARITRAIPASLLGQAGSS